MLLRQKKIGKYVAGLTLVEMLAAMFIMGVIGAVVVYNHKNFVDNLEITNLAYAVALSIREAQVSGISVQENPDADTGEEFQSAFGTHFNINSSSHGSFPGDTKAFLTFVDVDDSKTYNYGADYPDFNECNGSDDECFKVTEIGRGNFISKICYRLNGNVKCPAAVKSVDITFLRPKPDAHTRFRNSGGSAMPQEDKEAIICLESPQGRKRTVHVLQTGQISVRRETCGASSMGGGIQ